MSWSSVEGRKSCSVSSASERRPDFGGPHTGFFNSVCALLANAGTGLRTAVRGAKKGFWQYGETFPLGDRGQSVRDVGRQPCQPS